MQVNEKVSLHLVELLCNRLTKYWGPAKPGVTVYLRLLQGKNIHYPIEITINYRWSHHDHVSSILNWVIALKKGWYTGNSKVWHHSTLVVLCRLLVTVRWDKGESRFTPQVPNLATSPLNLQQNRNLYNSIILIPNKKEVYCRSQDMKAIKSWGTGRKM